MTAMTTVEEALSRAKGIAVKAISFWEMKHEDEDEFGEPGELLSDEEIEIRQIDYLQGQIAEITLLMEKAE